MTQMQRANAGMYYARMQTRYRRASIIYNPQAGRIRRNPERLALASEGLRRIAAEVVHAPTTAPRTAGAIALAEAERGSDLIVAYGGDGTVNEVVQSLARTEIHLAILPGGTANVLANEVGIGNDVGRAVELLRSVLPQRIALGLFKPASASPRYFVMMAGAGYDARLVYKLSIPLKNRIGKLAYWLTAFSELGRHVDEFDADCSGTTGRCSFALVSRVRNYGGDVHIARDAHLLDATFSVILFRGSTTIPYVKYFLGIIFNRLRGMNGVTMCRATNVRLDAPASMKIDVQLDGEHAGRLPAEIEIVPDALTLLIPSAYCDEVRAR